MKKLNNYAVAIILMVVVGFVGCQDNLLEDNFTHEVQNDKNKQVKLQVEVIDGILHFRNEEIFMEISEELMNMTIEERFHWCEEINFVSLEMEIEKVTEEMEKVKSKDELMSLVINNQEIIEDNDETIEAIQPLVFYQSITDVEGYYFIGNTIYKITRNKEYSLEDGDIKLLNSVIINNENGKYYEGFKENLLYESPIEPIKGYNENNPANLYYKSSNYREIKVQTIIVAHNYTNYSFMRVYVTSRSYKKSWGKYRPTKTWHKRKDFHLESNHVPIGVEQGPYYHPPVIYGYDDVFDLTYRERFTKVWTRYYNIGVIIPAVNGSYYLNPPNVISNLHGKFTCNAVGNHWVSY